jgi:hypothetical protein
VRAVTAPDPFRFESNRETATNESLADDNTVLTLLQPDSLGTIKKMLEDFGEISGLCCNYDKTEPNPLVARYEENTKEIRSILRPSILLLVLGPSVI